MQIVCPNCRCSYEVAPAALGAGGRSVRCVRCRSVWFAAPGEPVMAEAPAPAGARPVDDDRAGEKGETDEAVQAGAFDWSFSPDALAEENDTRGRDAALASDPRDAVSADEAARREREAAWSGGDAGLVAQTQAPALVPALEPDTMPAQHAAPEPENIETVAARRTSRSSRPNRLKLRLPRPGLPTAIVTLAAILACLIVWRSEVVRFAPQTASLFRAAGLPVNLRGLEFEQVRTTGEVHEGVPVLIVEGTIANVAGKTVEVPRLRFAMRNGAGHEIYAWTTVTGRSILAAGETAPFRTRLGSPPADGRDVIVRFFNRRDLLAGMR